MVVAADWSSQEKFLSVLECERAESRLQTPDGHGDTGHGLVTHGQGNQTAVQSLRRSFALAEAVLACCLWLRIAVMACGLWLWGVPEWERETEWEHCGCAGGGVGQRDVGVLSANLELQF
ncbi:Hypothetical predicted protein [Olea europaea subsp. europaea]|uniref:Uncharacterized protein n=1 Tax=Olea europaea subsp. europaea TaxID=158383 RepID=A0A8S0TGM1_OLEEU|nr:Hypothetical predicted protein [Olea europaea subsp. europaea]